MVQRSMLQAEWKKFNLAIYRRVCVCVCARTTEQELRMSIALRRCAVDFVHRACVVWEFHSLDYYPA